MDETSILIIDDNRQVLESLKFLLRKDFKVIETLTNPNVLPSALRKKFFDVYLLDMNFRAGIHSGNEGIFWMKEIRKSDPDAVFVMITAFGDVNLAVKAMKEGAEDFVLKPWDNENLRETLVSAVKVSRSKKEMKVMEGDSAAAEATPVEGDELLEPFSESMKKLYRDISKLAPTDANVLILGENGTGKEVIAEEIHRRSLRNDNIFLPVDMGAIPESLIESELFGHVKGAFTDAHTDKPGKFEAAGKGTLFLDEIGNLPFPVQSKLLSVLQSRKVSRIGSNKVVPLDIRIISATNQPLREMIDNGEFREDLFYRLNTISIEIPALRERKEDIIPLADHFIRIFSGKYKRKIKGMDVHARKMVLEYHWPGNIRELKHSIERAVILCEGEKLSEEDFSFPFASKEIIRSTQPLTLEELEKNAIREALERNRGNLTDTAGELGISRPTLYRKMQKYDL